MANTQKDKNCLKPSSQNGEHYSIHYDSIIVGQGLGGSLLAWEMIQQGRRVIVIDNQHHGSSSMVAAGIINPVTGHRSNLTSGFSDFLNIAQDTYQHLAETFGHNFFELIAQQRLIKNSGQKDHYLKRLNQDEYQAFIQPLSKGSRALKNSEFGVGNIQQTYRADSKALLFHLRNWLAEQQALIIEKLSYDDIHINAEKVSLETHNRISADNIIFCEGYQAIHNPWLKTLPFKLAKGDILTVQLDRTCPNMLNWGHWLLPLSKTANTAYLGSSYQWQDTSLNKDTLIAEQLIASLNKHTTMSAVTLEHQTGIRPTTLHRKQFIGTHPQHSNLYCFNGFGSKGCLTIPHYAKLLARHFSHQESLDTLMPELDSILPVDLEI